MTAPPSNASLCLVKTRCNRVVLAAITMVILVNIAVLMRFCCCCGCDKRSGAYRNGDAGVGVIMPVAVFGMVVRPVVVPVTGVMSRSDRHGSY